MTGTGVIDQFLDTYTRYIDSGFGLLGSEVGFLATTLAAIDITLAALFWSWGTDDDLIHDRQVSRRGARQPGIVGHRSCPALRRSPLRSRHGQGFQPDAAGSLISRAHPSEAPVGER